MSSRPVAAPLLTLALAALALGSAAAGQATLFVNEAVARGIIYTPQYPQTIGIYGYAAGFADLDGDGDDDIVAMGAAGGIVGLFENDGTGHFTDRTGTAGIAPLPQGTAFAAADFDGDGDTDLLFTSMGGGGCRLYRNLRREGQPWTFLDVTAGCGISTLGPIKAASWADIDLDGRLDLFLAAYRNATTTTMNIPSSLYRNEGEAFFVDIAPEIPGLVTPAYSFLGAFVDWDLDGDPDLYISNDRGHLGPFFQGNQVFRNDDGTLVDMSAKSPAAVSCYSMGVAVGDLNADGWPDLYVTNIAAHAMPPVFGVNPLLLGGPDGSFVRGEALWGVGDFPSGTTGWGTLLFDLDDDGDHDLFVRNMWSADRLFLNPGAPPCTDITLTSGLVGPSGPSFAVSAADIDGDGDLDLLTSDAGHLLRLHINRSPGAATNRSLFLRIVGEGANPEAIGATALVRLDPGAPPRFRDVSAGGRSYLGQDSRRIHVGLGLRSSLAEAAIAWPRIGKAPPSRRTLVGLPSGRTWTVYPPARLGDADGDGRIGPADRSAFAACLAAGFTPGCEMMDFDGNSALDAADRAAFDRRQSDLSGDGAVGSADLAILLAAFGTGDPDADLDGDGAVGAGDLLVLLASWG